MVTVTALNRKSLFAECCDGESHYSEEGKVVFETWRSIPKKFPQIETSTLVVMPDHVHGILHVKERMLQPLGMAVRYFKSLVTSQLRVRNNNPNLHVWNKGFHDTVVYRKGMLKALSEYIRDNPRRLCMKRANSHLFTRVGNLVHTRLPKSEQWQGYGNLFLLDKPLLVNVRVSRSVTPEEIERLGHEVRGAVRQGAVVVSPFISAGEKAIAEMIMELECGELILMKHVGFEEHYKPSGKYFDLCAAGRLLILSAFPSTAGKIELSRKICLAMNRWCEAISETEVEREQECPSAAICLQ